ncbi:MAG: four helix bundle protein [Chitinophagaceae bacterium]|nr:four helix bundle protein [Chitinophagaceae bacterium]
METRNIIVENVLDFGLEVVRFCELLNERRRFVVSNQLLRSGTSVGAHVFEAQHAETKADFIHKMKIAVKEASETLFWLLICERSSNYPESSSLKIMVEEIIRIISKIIITSKGGFRHC